MNQTTMPRSSFVTTLAWIFIVLGGLSSLMAIAQNLMLHLAFPLDEMKEQMAATPESEHVPAFARFMMEHFELVFGAFLVITLATFISAVGLLKRQNWARMIFIGLMVTGAAWNLAVLVLQQVAMSQMPVPPDMPPEFRQQMESMQQIMMVVSTVFCLGFAGLFGWIAWRLRAPGVVAEFRSA